MLTIRRQGDLSFIRTTTEPPAVTPKAPVLLARGEESGHWHTLVGGNIRRDGDKMFIDVPGPGPARVVVEPASHAGRHEPLELDPGTWEVPGVPDPNSEWLGQREYSPEAIRAVGD